MFAYKQEAEDGEISGAWNNLASYLTNKTGTDLFDYGFNTFASAII